MDKKKLTFHIRGILEALGDDPEREGLKETPVRAAAMFEEMFEGMNYTNEEIAGMFSKTFTDDCLSDSQNAITVSGIEFFSYCEHHIALMYNMTAEVTYIPNGKVLGLSKIARICDMAGKRLQLQERITSDIAQIVSIAADTPDVAVTVKASHSCMTARGIKKTSAQTVTTVKLGKMKGNQ
ncbi:MAG: GTP cyclohydrolase I [Oscillospiraceae bacterium]|jgi:GTP cyclohydrolase I|nr:GTP cyclohydrolase I [Oscillospiraceae bacterium]